MACCALAGERSLPIDIGKQIAGGEIWEPIEPQTGVTDWDTLKTEIQAQGMVVPQYQYQDLYPTSRPGRSSTSYKRKSVESRTGEKGQVEKLEEAGVAFTARFATSTDLKKWQLTSPECVYAKDRYSAPHCLRWLDGWFYDFYLEAHDGYEMRVVRSRDLVHWEPSPLNPVLRASEEDRRTASSKLTLPQRDRISKAVNINNSDIDFCEHQGRLVINYSWGNQQGVEHLAEAIYMGSQEQFLKGWFPAASTSQRP